MVYLDGVIYAGCVRDLDMRRKWMPGIGVRDLEWERTKGKGGGELMRDRVIKWDVEVHPTHFGTCGSVRLILPLVD